MNAQSGAELLGRIKPKLREESTQICLRPDLLDAWEDVNARLAQAKMEDSSTSRLAQGAKTSKKTEKIALEVQDLEKQIADASIWFRFRGMAKDAWQALTASHPPRKGDEIDRYVGYNRDAVQDAAVRLCLFDPVFEDCADVGCEHDDCGTWQAFTKVCNSGEWVELQNTCNIANQSVVGDPPKSVLASQILSKRVSGSRPRAAGV